MFLSNVPTQIPNINRRMTFGKISNQLTKTFSTYSLKTTKLWIDFISRLDADNFGVTIIHVALLQQLTRHQLYKQALKFISTMRLPLTISILNYYRYLIMSVDVYLQYSMYDKAYECLTLVLSIESGHLEQEFIALKLFVLVSNLMNKSIDKKDYIQQVDKVKLNCRQQIQELLNKNDKKVIEFEMEVELFGKICEQAQLMQQELKYLQKKGFLEIYLKSQNIKQKQLRKQIQMSIYNPILYRIKCSQIKNEPLQVFQTIKSLNFPQPLFKFDKINSIMYFEHNKMSHQRLDQEIYLISAIQEIIRTRPNLKMQAMDIQRFNQIEDEKKPTAGFFSRMVGGMFGGLP